MIECLYDEDLSENLFFQVIKIEFNHLIDQATKENWIVCIPKTGSFEISCLTENDYFYHFLIPNEESSGICYQTLNGKKVTVVNKIISVEDENESLSTSILFEETFYTQDLLKYKIWCIECLLNQNYIKNKFNNSINTVLTFRDCLDFLWSESSGKDTLEQLDSTINNFLIKNSSLYKYTLETQQDLVHSLYNQCLQITLCDKKISESISKSKQILNNVNISIEAYMQHNIFKLLFNSISVYTSYDDSCFNKIIRNLSDVQLRDLDIQTNVHDAIPCAKRQLAKINGFSTILGKISCLRNTVSEISQIKTDSTLSVDDLLPVFVFLILKTCIPNWVANLCFLQRFHFSHSSTGDEENFLITTLEAAIQYIKSGIFLTPSEPDSHLNVTVDLKKFDDKNKISYFFDQVRVGNYDEVKNILIENNACKNELEIKSKELCHPLCSCDQCEKILSQILITTPTVNSTNDRGYTALHVACMYGKPKIVELLLEYDADMQKVDYSGATALHYAALRGHQNALLLLLHSGTDVNHVDNEKNTALHLCCNNGHDTCVKAILYFVEHQDKILNVNCCNVSGDTPLHNAARWGYKSIIQILLEYGADPNVTNNLKKTPYDCAHNLNIYQMIMQAKCKYKEEARKFLNKENDINNFDFVEESSEETATKPCSPYQMKRAEMLLKAVAYDDVPMICYYLGLPIPDNHLTSSTLCHPLCNCEKCESQNDSIINTNVININICNSEGYTALHVASLHGQIDIVRLLLNNGALPNIVTNKGLTALHLACQTQRLEIVKLLLQTDRCKVNLQDLKGNAALHYACGSRDVNIVQELIEYKAEIEIRNLNGKTPLDESDGEIFDYIRNLNSRN